jgi:hypothetical protein
MSGKYDPLVKFVGNNYIFICIFYLVVSVGLGFIEALRKNKKEIIISEDRYRAIFLLLTIPLLFPMIFAMFGGALGILLYAVLYLFDSYLNANLIYILLIAWFVGSIAISIKAYKSIYKTYSSKSNNGAI